MIIRHKEKKTERFTRQLPPQEQKPPGKQMQMVPKPIEEDPRYNGSGKLAGKVALITGGDSGIGKSVAIAFAKEGADIAILYLKAHDDAERTCQRIIELGRDCLSIAGDVGKKQVCEN